MSVYCLDYCSLALEALVFTSFHPSHGLNMRQQRTLLLWKLPSTFATAAKLRDLGDEDSVV